MIEIYQNQQKQSTMTILKDKFEKVLMNVKHIKSNMNAWNSGRAQLISLVEDKMQKLLYENITISYEKVDIHEERRSLKKRATSFENIV